jgi:hypothetical protein
MSQNRNTMGRIEDFLQGSVEGVFNRIFRSGLQKEEIARKLERAMDEHVSGGGNQQRVPNVYHIYISQSDYGRFQQFARLLTRQLQEGLFQVSRQRGYTMLTTPVVTLEADTRLGKGEIRIDTETQDRAQLAAAAPSAVATPVPSLGADIPPDVTVAIGPQPIPSPDGAATPAGAPVALPEAALVMRTPQGPGQRYPLNREVIHIGRHRSNDIVIREERISRYHAEIRFERGQFVLYDLGSLNGVLVNGMLSRQAILHSGDVVNIGSYSFVFERR